MSGVLDASSYFPERPPTWLEVGLTVLVAGTVAGKLLRGAVVSWPALGVGFAVFALALGPGTQSALGARVGQWFRAIGTAARGALIVLCIVGFALLSRSHRTARDCPRCSRATR